MAQTKTKVISGVEFQVAPFQAIEGLRLKAYLIKTFGPALGQLLGSLETKTTLEDAVNQPASNLLMSGDTLSKSIENLMEHLSEEQFVALIRRLFQNVVARGTTEDGKPFACAFGADFNTALDLAFQGRLFGIYPLIYFILEVNYPDFFTMVLPAIGVRTRTAGVTKKVPRLTKSSVTTLENSEPLPLT